jgi:hypothetical protein
LTELDAQPGLHVVTLYTQVHELAEVEELVKKHALQFPIAMDAIAFENAGYVSPQLPRAWVIGVDGTFAYAGIEDYKPALDKELAKVKYPGLGKAAVHKDLEPAAKAFVAGNYAEAFKLAEDIYDNTEDDAAEADADYIMERVDDALGTLTVRAETAEIMKDYALAIACWAEATRYKGMDDAEEAPARLKKLQDDKAVQKEIAASRELLRLTMSLDVKFQPVDDANAAEVAKFRKLCVESYRKFATDNAGTGAADSATELAKGIEALLPQEIKPTDPPKEEK